MFRLRVLGGERSGETFALKAGETHVVGRGYDAQFRFPEDPAMSRVHAELALVGNWWVLRNKSRHGTWVGGAEVENERLLRGGDEITLGKTRLVFEPDPAQTGVPVTPSFVAGTFTKRFGAAMRSCRDRAMATVASTSWATEGATSTETKPSAPLASS